jgi:MarR family transcriptional regulator, organic hydroperoxide resistance regulator
MAAPEADHRLDSTLDFMRLLWSIEHGLQKQSKRMAAQLGLTGPQRLVLRIVTRFPGLSAGELARIVRLHPSTITGIIQRLVSRRLLRRERDPGDSRRTRLWPTAGARRYTARTAGTVEETVGRAIAAAGAGNVRGARFVLGEIARALNESGGSTARRATRPGASARDRARSDRDGATSSRPAARSRAPRRRTS